MHTVLLLNKLLLCLALFKSVRVVPHRSTFHFTYHGSPNDNKAFKIEKAIKVKHFYLTNIYFHGKFWV